MKPITYISLITILLLGVVACKKKEGYRIGVSQCSDDDWRMLLNDEIEQEILFYPDASVEIRSARDDSRRQIEDIRYFMENGFDIIIAAPNEAHALTPVIEEAYNRGIPILLFDRSINGDSFTAFQGADNEEIGRQAARYTAGLLPSGSKILELRGLEHSTPALGRSKGFKEYIDSVGGGLEISGFAVANWNYDDAVKAADSLLTLHPDAALIYAHNDRMALGAADVAEKKGLRPKIIGVDAAPGIGQKAVADGRIDATFLYPTEGDRLIQTAMAILKGDKFKRTELIPVTSAVDKSNIDVIMLQSAQITEESAKMRELKEEVDTYWNRHSSQTALLYAAIAILILVCVVLFLVLRTFWQHKRHQAELLEKNRELQEQRDLEKELNGRLEAATQSKLRFFTNVSHDLRTPLTLISEPVAQLASAPNIDERQRLLMRIADKNVKILHRLINQILDFRKFENGKLDVHLEEAAPGLFVNEWAEAFRPLANKKHITFSVQNRLSDGFTMAFDVDKIERVVFNLLSNAFKFTPVKGKVDFIVNLKDGNLEITVKDTGRGISADNLKSIFDRFYQVDKVRPEGSGIGLNLAKAFVEVHGGTVKVRSEENAGTEFVVILPVTHVDNAVDESAVTASGESARMAAGLVVTEDISPDIAGDTDDGRPIVLVIDDNEDVRIMVRELLKDRYRVVEASGGEEGIRKAAMYVPDAIICDVMMPGIDGMETCRGIKKEVSTSHIPVLMLTACSLDEQRVEGYRSGADGYISKPFNREVLLARVEALIANRKLVRDVLVGDSQTEGPASENTSNDVLADRENEFYRRFVAIVEEEMGNEGLSVDMLAERMGLGRSQFYRKLKAITGLSPVELLRDHRLKRAHSLLISTDKTVSEIGYEVGFSTPAYFTKCYREVYSETPTATRERIKSR